MVPRKNKPQNILDGYEDIRDMLDQFDLQLKDAVARPTDGQKRYERDWEILQLEHKRARYIYDSYLNELIPHDVYTKLLAQTQFTGTKHLIAKWKKQGYENLCCLGCIKTDEKNFNATCICRVPKESLKEERSIKCVTCGCEGCASSD